MKIIVSGSRYWSEKKHYSVIFAVLKQYDQKTTIITGGCRGVDALAEKAARKLGMTVVTYPAKWQQYGRAAGPIRNEQMITQERPDMVLLFHDDIENSRGTKNMRNLAKKYGITAKLIPCNLSH